MGIFSRLSDIVNSNLNALLDRAEDPQKVIRLVIQEMEDTLVEVRSAAVRLIAERREGERRIVALTRDRDEWQRKAEFAVQRGREDLAKAALLAKSRAAQAIAEAQTQIDAVQAAIAQQNEDVGKLQAKLDDAKSREKAILLRQAERDDAVEGEAIPLRRAGHRCIQPVRTGRTQSRHDGRPRRGV
jgi:Phage shock protein A (IM30), suppresses sigma54-dependent transcription